VAIVRHNGEGAGMSGLRQLRPISVEEYLEGERYSDILHEYVDGEPYAMVGATVTHNSIAINLVLALGNHLRGTACRVFAGSMKVRVGDDFYYPDVFVACERPEGERLFLTRPVLIVEVLSPGTELRDTRDKLLAYQAIESLREYVLVEQERREVRVIRRTAEGWESVTCTGTTPVRLESVDLTLSLDDIYRDVEASP
jgi:Uma2 family endonuclease